jgi:hypothetical protein
VQTYGLLARLCAAINQSLAAHFLGLAARFVSGYLNAPFEDGRSGTGPT